jgi:hypothetical protein
MAVCGSIVPDKNASGDSFYGPLICPQPVIDYLWTAYSFRNLSASEGGWQHGWGFEAPCDTDLPLARTFAGLYALTYSAPDWQNDGYDKPILNFARRYVRENIDDLMARCGDGTASAQSFFGPFVNDRVELYTGYWYGQAVVERASTLLHEARHQGGKHHNANFPPGSAYGPGRPGADSNWDYQGAWTYEANYLWWFFTTATNTTTAMKNLARQVGNFIIDNAFATRPPFHI